MALRYHKNIVLLTAVCLLIKLALFAAVKPWKADVAGKIILESDAQGYHQLAVSVLKFHRFSFSQNDPPETLRTPMYPFFIAAVYRVFGIRPWAVILIQMALSVLGCIVFYMTARLFFTDRIALWSSLFFALDPHTNFFIVNLLSETVLVFFLLAATFFFLKTCSSGKDGIRPWFLCVAALFFGCSALVKPITLGLPVFLCILVLLTRRKTFRNALGTATVFLAVFGLSVLPWYVRNYLKFKAFSFSTAGSFNSLVLFVAPFEGEKRHLPVPLVRQTLLGEADSLMARDGLNPARLNPFQKGRYWKCLATRYIARNPGLFLKHYFNGIVHMLFTPGTKGFLTLLNLPNEDGTFDVKNYPSLTDSVSRFFKGMGTGRRWMALVICLYMVLLYAFSFFGFLKAFKSGNGLIVFFASACLIVIVYFVLCTGPRV